MLEDCFYRNMDFLLLSLFSQSTVTSIYAQKYTGHFKGGLTVFETLKIKGVVYLIAIHF